MPPRPDVSAERRAQIIQAALACFTRKGYNNTTMDDIVAESGLSKGSLYWYFKSKDDLFAAAFLSSITNFGQEAIAGLDQFATASGKLRALAQAMVGFCQTAEGLFSLLVEFYASSPRREEAGQLWADVFVQYNEIVAEIIEEGVRNGEFKPVDSKSLVWAMMATYDSLAVYAMVVPGMDVDRISQVFVETLLSGLAVGGQGNGQEGD